MLRTHTVKYPATTMPDCVSGGEDKAKNLTWILKFLIPLELALSGEIGLPPSFNG